MDSSDDVIDEIDVERIAYAAIGRQLRTMCVLALLLLVIGFLMGHHIASQHARQMSHDFGKQVELFRGRLAGFEKDLAAARLAPGEGMVDLRVQITQLEHLLSEQNAALEAARRANDEAEQRRRAFAIHTAEQMEADRRSLMRELKPYFEQNRSVSAGEVSSALTRVVDAQVGRLSEMIDLTETEACEVSDRRMPLVPTSQSGPTPTVAIELGTPQPFPIASGIDLGPPPSVSLPEAEPVAQEIAQSPAIESAPPASPDPTPLPPVVAPTPPAPVRYQPIIFSPRKTPPRTAEAPVLKSIQPATTATHDASAAHTK